MVGFWEVKIVNELINVEAINDYINTNNWTSYRFSKELGLDYSYVYRVLKNEVNGGNKFISRLIDFCNKNKIEISQFIFLRTPLSRDNNHTA